MIARPSLAADLTDLAAWWWCVVRMSARQGWEALPGPWPVKVALLLLLVAGQLIPGEADEIIFLAILGWVKRRMDARKLPATH